MAGNKRILILIDFQHDFIYGSLAVPGATAALWRTITLLCKEKFDKVVFTLDWHPINHSSFKINGGIWPVHCVAYTEAALPEKLLIQYCINNKIPYTVVCKGCDKEEEYGAFSQKTLVQTWGSNKEEVSRKFSVTGLGIVEALDEYVIAGIAGDYCVLETIKNLKEVGISPIVYTEGIASMDKGFRLEEYIAKHKLKKFVPEWDI